MELRDLGPDGQQALEQILGYLNFSSGATDTQFLSNLNLLFGLIEAQPRAKRTARGKKGRKPPTPNWQQLVRLWRDGLDALEDDSATFHDSTQARAVLSLLTDHVVPALRRFHRDLLFHHSDDSLMKPFFLGRVIESILQQGAPWEESERIVPAAIAQLNDYVGYRPVAVLESRVLEPYAHERVRPIPVYIEGAGVAVGDCQEVVTLALQMLRDTDPLILREAFFVPENLAELAVDPRAYDFEHPANKRPNYHFGQWDPHCIDNRGFYNRFVIQQVTLDALMSRIDRTRRIAKAELRVEAAAVLAGTMLMASGVSGAGPDTHDSTTTLGNLLPRVAAFRDAFYEELIQRLEEHSPEHAERLQQEARRLRQPFGGARQDLNAQLTRRRASQLEHVRLASLFARMGYPDAAQRQIDAVPVASSRMICQIDCHLTLSQRDIETGDLETAQNRLTDIRNLLQRGIECGAIIDPWNILGFDGNFSLFPAMENSIHDHRVDELLNLIEEIYCTYGQLWSSAAAADDQAICARVSAEFSDFARWWHQFAVHEVSGADATDAMDIFRASENVSDALNHWHKSGEATGDIGFWAPYVDKFDSAKAYAMVVDMLLDRRDFVAARGLLIHWLSQAENVPLEQGEESFQRLALRWMVEVLELRVDEKGDREVGAAADWARTRKFFDYMEANAADFWKVPSFNIEDLMAGDDEEGSDSEVILSFEDEADEEAEDEDDLFGAAYEDVVYRDSTDDGIDGSIFDTQGSDEDHLDIVHDEIVGRLSFLNTLARLRRVAALARMVAVPSDSDDPPPLEDSFQHWLDHDAETRKGLERLLIRVERYRLSRPDNDYLSMAEFDRERMIKESLMEHIITTSVEIAQTDQFMHCVLQDSEMPVAEDESSAIMLLRAATQGKMAEAQIAWEQLKDALASRPILYVPLARGGDAKAIVKVRNRQQMLRVLLAWLPRLGLLNESRQLIDVIRAMERSTPAGPGAVTEFDDLFDVGFRALVDCVIRATNVNETQDLAPSEGDGAAGPQLVSCLEGMTESMLVTWLSHSRTLRLSVLEKVKGGEAWQDLVRFIKRYGEDVFTQQFLSLANVRGILFQGVDNWLQHLEEDPPADLRLRLLDELDSELPRDDAARYLTLVLEAVVENYAEYRDYNSTTTQSDRGDLLYNLLDFLRLLSKYERVVWNLKPVVLAHELLVRRGCNDAAQMWRRALADRISEEADRYVKRLARLQQRYAMQLPTIADRVNERFLRPLIIDRMRALVQPAVAQRSERAFAILEDESALLMKQPSGVGFEPPAWLVSLEDEVRRVRQEARSTDEQQLFESLLPTINLSIEEVQRQIDTWSRYPEEEE